MVEGTPHVKRAVVLEGGGAKGAWQFGVLFALHEIGLRVDAIAGTSVGALNAFLFSVGHLSYGLSFWRTLERNRLFTERVPPPLVTLTIAWMLGSSVFLSSLGNMFDDLPAMLPKRWVLLINTVTFYTFWLALTTIGGFGDYGKTPLSHLRAFLLCSLGPMVMVALFVRLKFFGLDFSSMAHLYNSIALPICLVTSFRQVAFFSGGTGSIGRLAETFERGFAHPVLEALAILIFFINLGGICARWGVLESKGLRDQLVALSDKPPLLQVYVTVSGKYEVYDPDMQSVATGVVAGTTQSAPVSKTIFVPSYFRLGMFEPVLRVRTLLASSALPLGILRPVNIGVGTYVDGGMSDNLPILPLLRCGVRWDEIIIIHCSAAPRSYEEHVSKIWRNIQLKEYTKPPKKVPGGTFIPVINETPKNLPYRRFKINASVKPISPEGEMGGFLSGTLNFSSKYTVPRLAEGLREGIAFAERNWPDLVRNAPVAIQRIERLIAEMRTT